jgi:hypothetical protein
MEVKVLDRWEGCEGRKRKSGTGDCGGGKTEKDVHILNRVTPRPPHIWLQKLLSLPTNLALTDHHPLPFDIQIFKQ